MRNNREKTSLWMLIGMEKFIVVLLFAMFLFACTDYVSQIENERDVWIQANKEKSFSSSSAEHISTKVYDCSVTGGVKVVYPAGGETFKIGDEITVVYGTDVDCSGYRFVFKMDEKDIGMDLFDRTMGLEGKGDGKTCYEQKVKLSMDVVNPTSTGIIRVMPYENSRKGANSVYFNVVRQINSNAESSSSMLESSSEKSVGVVGAYDCSVTGGVKVVYPAGGETFKFGDEITVVYGSDVESSGYRFVFKMDEEDIGIDLLEESAGPKIPDGKTCYEQKVKLSKDVVEPTSTGIIRVVPYEDSKKGANSGKFKVVE